MRMAAQPTLKLSPASRPRTANGSTTRRNISGKPKGAQAYQILGKLRAEISEILEKRGITVLPAEEWRKPVPGLHGGEDTIPGIEGRSIRVLDAFFFEEM